MKPKVVALMGAASFCAWVRHKRYSRQQEIATENYLPLMLNSSSNFAVSGSAFAENPDTYTPFFPVMDLIPYTTASSPGSDSPSYRYTWTISNFSGFFLIASQFILKSQV